MYYLTRVKLSDTFPPGPVIYSHRLLPAFGEYLRKLMNVLVRVRPRPQRKPTSRTVPLPLLVVPVEVQFAQILGVRGPLKYGQLYVVDPRLSPVFGRHVGLQHEFLHQLGQAVARFSGPRVIFEFVDVHALRRLPDL